MPAVVTLENNGLRDAIAEAVRQVVGAKDLVLEDGIVLSFPIRASFSFGVVARAGLNAVERTTVSTNDGETETTVLEAAATEQTKRQTRQRSDSREEAVESGDESTKRAGTEEGTQTSSGTEKSAAEQTSTAKEKSTQSSESQQQSQQNAEDASQSEQVTTFGRSQETKVEYDRAT